jgi:hypothetical protein
MNEKKTDLVEVINEKLVKYISYYETPTRKLKRKHFVSWYFAKQSYFKNNSSSRTKEDEFDRALI